MANCIYCGSVLRDGAKFCLSCGKPQMPSMGQPVQGQSVQQPYQQPVQQTPPIQQQAPQPGMGQQLGQMAAQYGGQVARTAATQAVGMAASAGMATAMPGEFTMGEFGGVMGMVSQGVNMVRGAGGKLSGLKNAKKSMVGPIITAVLFAILWIVQYILTKKGIDNPFTKVLGWLTYSSGGTSSNFLPMIGGFFGKGMVAMAFCSLFNGGAKSMVGGIKKVFSGETFKGINVGPILLGFGVAMVCYQFFTGYGTLTGGMTAVGGLAVALRTLGGGGGLIRFLIGLITSKKKMGENKTGSTMWGGFSMGMSFGFTAAIPLATIKYSWTHIFVGAGCVIVGLIIALATKDIASKKMQGPQYPGGMMN